MIAAIGPTAAAIAPTDWMIWLIEILESGRLICGDIVKRYRKVNIPATNVATCRPNAMI